MDRPTVARRRGIACLAVVGSLLASTLAPALMVSAQPIAPTTAAATAQPSPAQPSPDAIFGVAGSAPPPGDLSVVALGTPSRNLSDPPRVGPVERPHSGCDPAPATVRPAVVVRHGPRDQKVVALTFDDGWNPANTLNILGTLKRFHVNATFFPVGRAVQLFPYVWQAVADAGFPIGDHSYDHPHLKGLCFAGQLSQLRRPQAIIRDVLGIEPFDVMRPPYGAYDWNTRLAANAAGDARVVLWDVDTRDWDGLSRFQIARLALAGHEGSIVLMHTFPHATAAALIHIIYGYRQRGYRFVTIGQLLGLGGPVPYL
jgi:peptidoglycan/xylan/chitin deacetylase (PgdA/CDA1 family)